MAGNSIGTLFRVTTWGESHGPSLGVIIDGCPAGISIRAEEIQGEVDRRKPKEASGGTARKEQDQIEILSGIFEGVTTGAPVTIMVRNEDHRSRDYEELKGVLRPGHADLSYELKYGRNEGAVRDYRGGGRASGRETVSRVIAGAVAKKILHSYSPNTTILGHTIQIGDIKTTTFQPETILLNPLYCADPEATSRMLSLIETVRNDHDSIGGIIEIRVKGSPTGLGEPVFDKLHADLGKALFSIPAVKGVAFGKGFETAIMRGSEHNDSYTNHDGKINAKTNHAGGILGGISTGEDIIIHVAIKPPSSIGKEQSTVTNDGKPTTMMIKGRHDACIVPRAIPVTESMVAITLVDHLLRQRAMERSEAH